MTREEEIKERMANDKAMGYWPTHYDTATYLLARNEELQRRVWRLEAGLEEILTRKMSMAANYTHLIKQIYHIARFTLDAKEQDDD